MVFRWDEAELIDQWQVNSRAAFLRAVSVISAKTNEANSLRIALGKQDSAVATCRATLDLYMARDIAQGGDLDKQRKKIQRLQPWATVGKITAAGAVLWIAGAILHR